MLLVSPIQYKPQGVQEVTACLMEVVQVMPLQVGILVFQEQG
jgi:hypothetical protein